MIHVHGLIDTAILGGTIASFSDTGEVYDWSIDFRSGDVKCSCPDFVCRKKAADVMDEKAPHGCKHCRALLRHPLIKSAVETACLLVRRAA